MCVFATAAARRQALLLERCDDGCCCEALLLERCDDGCCDDGAAGCEALIERRRRCGETWVTSLQGPRAGHALEGGCNAGAP
jgi:hypothetical protein